MDSPAAALDSLEQREAATAAALQRDRSAPPKQDELAPGDAEQTAELLLIGTYTAGVVGE